MTVLKTPSLPCPYGRGVWPCKMQYLRFEGGLRWHNFVGRVLAKRNPSVLGTPEDDGFRGLNPYPTGAQEQSRGSFLFPGQEERPRAFRCDKACGNVTNRDPRRWPNFVGWVERSETHRLLGTEDDGFRRQPILRSYGAADNASKGSLFCLAWARGKDLRVSLRPSQHGLRENVTKLPKEFR